MSTSSVERIWYSGQPPPLWMRALVPLYRLLVCLRALPYRMGLLRPTRIPVPLVVVGNVSVGGTGKTPLALALVEFLRERGWNPGVVSRGHGGSERGPLLLDETATPDRVGDEPCLMHRRGVPVAIGRRRDRAASLLPAIGVDVIIADDGLQNLGLGRDLEICVVDGARRLGNGRLLPAGPLRESPGRLARVDFVVCNGNGAGRNEIPMHLGGDHAVSLEQLRDSRPLSAVRGHPVHAVAGIGNPQRFFAHLRQEGLDVIEHAFPDHHPLTIDDLAFNDHHAVLMTEKDAVKLAAVTDARLWFVPVQADLPLDFLDALDSRLRKVRDAIAGH